MKQSNNSVISYCIAETASLAQAAWQIHSVAEELLFVLNAQGQIQGFLHASFLPHWNEANEVLCVKDVYRTDVNCVFEGKDEYKEARNIFADFPSIHILPIVDTSKHVVRVLRRHQCFFKEYYFEAIRTRKPSVLPMPQYAVAIWRGAEIASSTGHKSMSVIEFGVAAGNGLLICEQHCKEIAKIFDIQIQIYGFDGAEGLPASEDWRDVPHCWEKGFSYE